MDIEGAESDVLTRFGSNTNDDAYSEGHALYDVSIDDKGMQPDVDYAA